MEAVAGEDAGAADAQFLGDRGDRAAGRRDGQGRRRSRRHLRVLRLGQFRHLLGDGGVRRGLVLARVAGLQAEVLRVGGEQIAGAHVAGAQALAPRDPFGGQEGVGAGQQHDLVERHQLRAGRPGDRHRPAPAPVAELLALEEVRDHPVAVRFEAGMLADHAGRGGLLGCGTGEVDGLGAQAVGGAASRGRCAHRYRFSPTPSHGCACCGEGSGRSG